MKHDLSNPCNNCPFRNDGKGVPLTAGRIVEIHRSLAAQGRSFSCHKTVAWQEGEDETEHVAGPNEQQCAGAEIYLLHQGRCSQLGRIAERLGRAAVLNENAPVCRSLDELLEVHGHEAGPGEDAEGDHCSVCGPSCLAPGGYMVNGEIIVGVETVNTWCESCGECVCEACAVTVDGSFLCDGCAEYEA